MISKEVEIKAEDGFDARRVALCVQEASRYESEIHLIDKTYNMNAKSLMGMMALGLACGSKIKVVASGSDETEALEAVSFLLESKI